MSEVVDLDQYSAGGDSVTIHTSLGDISFTSMAVDDLSTLERIINDSQLDDRQATIAILNVQQMTKCDLTQLDDNDLRRVVTSYAGFERSIFGNVADTPTIYSDFRTALQRYSAEVVANISRIIQPTIEPIRRMMADITRQITAVQSIFEPINRIAADIQRIVKPLIDIVGDISPHFPRNWPIARRVDCAKLCEQGLPIVFVPSTHIINELLAAKTPAAQKRVLVRHDTEIIQDCRDQLNRYEVVSRELIDHITASIDAYQVGNYRAAQSTATIAFDALMPIIYDMRVRYKGKGNKLAARYVHALSSDLATDILRHPLTSHTMFYSMACLPMIAHALARFDIGDRTTYAKDFNRHTGTHTVSAQQYKHSNALIAIMTVTSLCVVTEKRGRYWLSGIAKFYDKF